MAGERLLLAVAAFGLVAAALPAPAGAAPADLCETAGIADTCEQLLSTAEARDVAAGWYHSCALLVTGNVDCWGLDDHGQAGDYVGGDAVDVSAGAERTCALLRGGDVTCWGANLGLQSRVGTAVQDTPMGNAAELDVGGFHVCVRTGDTPVNGTLEAATGTRPGDAVCRGDGTYGQAEDRRTGDVVEVAAGGYHSCATLETGALTCWGYREDNRSTTRPAGTTVEAGPGTTCILQPEGHVDCFGREDLGQDAGYDGTDAAEVAPGGTHVCVRTDGGDVVCDGDDRYGQAADDDRGDVQAISAGYVHTCALRLDGSVDCWGDDRHGQAEDRLPGLVPMPD